jgi:hypothetical protein
MSSCYATNNIHFNFPPIMDDGRNFASWQPEAVINKQIQQSQGIKSNWEYRRYLTNNATTVMKFNAQEAIENSGVNPFCQSGNTPSSNVPYVFKNTFDTSSPGFGYSTSDLKSPYLSREQLQARMIAPSIQIKDVQ